MGFPIQGTPVVGVDLGGSNVRAGLFDAAGDVVAEAAEPTAGASAAAVLEQVGALARRLAAEAGVELEAVGVGVPGVVAGGTLRMAPNLPPFGDVDVAAALADELDADVVVDNDVNMATLAEHRRGLGDGVDDFVFIAVGTGVGMGVVAGGRLLRGAHGAAGEIGELPLGDGVRLEDVAGGVGVAQRGGRPTAHDVFAAAGDGDAAAVDVLDAQIDAIARAVAAAHCVLDPALVVLGGGIGSRVDVVERVARRVEVRVAASALGEAAGMIGAAEAARLRMEARVDA